jgi:hypothetical protein
MPRWSLCPQSLAADRKRADFGMDRQVSHFGGRSDARLRQDSLSGYTDQLDQITRKNFQITRKNFSRSGFFADVAHK